MNRFVKPNVVFIDDEEVNLTRVKKFFIDEAGRKHIHKLQEGMQGLECRFDDIIILDNGIWRIRNKSDDLLDKKNNLFSNLMSLCDTKQDKAESFILKHKNTIGQRRRYQDKYERALNGEFSAEERASIITNYETARNAIRAFSDLIEFFRQTVDDWIVGGQLVKAEKAIIKAKGFDEKTTLSDVNALLANVEDES